MLTSEVKGLGILYLALEAKSTENVPFVVTLSIFSATTHRKRYEEGGPPFKDDANCIGHRMGTENLLLDYLSESKNREHGGSEWGQATEEKTGKATSLDIRIYRKSAQLCAAALMTMHAPFHQPCCVNRHGTCGDE